MKYTFLFDVGVIFVTINPRTAGGGYPSPPLLRFFVDSEKTVAHSAAKLAIAVQPTI